MANESEAPQSENVAKATPPPRPAADGLRLTREGWREHARFKFGVSPHAIAGALAHRDPQEVISEADVRSALEEFATREGVSSEDE